MHPHELAMAVHVPPPLLGLPPASRPLPPCGLSEPWFEFPESQQIPADRLFTCVAVHASMRLSIYLTHSFLPTPRVHESVLYVRVSIISFPVRDRLCLFIFWIYMTSFYPEDISLLLFVFLSNITLLCF